MARLGWVLPIAPAPARQPRRRPTTRTVRMTTTPTTTRTRKMMTTRKRTGTAGLKTTTSIRGGALGGEKLRSAGAPIECLCISVFLHVRYMFFRRARTSSFFCHVAWFPKCNIPVEPALKERPATSSLDSSPRRRVAAVGGAGARIAVLGSEKPRSRRLLHSGALQQCIAPT
jgi:hypothetical protein